MLSVAAVIVLSIAVVCQLMNWLVAPSFSVHCAQYSLILSVVM